MICNFFCVCIRPINFLTLPSPSPSMTPFPPVDSWNGNLNDPERFEDNSSLALRISDLPAIPTKAVMYILHLICSYMIQKKVIPEVLSSTIECWKNTLQRHNIIAAISDEHPRKPLTLQQATS